MSRKIYRVISRPNHEGRTVERMSLYPIDYRPTYTRWLDEPHIWDFPVVFRFLQHPSSIWQVSCLCCDEEFAKLYTKSESAAIEFLHKAMAERMML